MVSISYLPSCRAVAVSFVLEVGNVCHHPLVDLTQGEPLFRGTLDGLGDEVGVGEIAPGVSSRRALLGGRRGGGGGLLSRPRHDAQRADEGRRPPGSPASAAAAARRGRGPRHHVLVVGHQAVVGPHEPVTDAVGHHEVVALLPQVDGRRGSRVVRVVALQQVVLLGGRRRLVVHRVVGRQASVQEAAVMGLADGQRLHQRLFLHHHFHRGGVGGRGSIGSSGPRVLPLPPTQHKLATLSTTGTVMHHPTRFSS